MTEIFTIFESVLTAVAITSITLYGNIGKDTQNLLDAPMKIMLVNNSVISHKLFRATLWLVTEALLLLAETCQM